MQLNIKKDEFYLLSGPAAVTVQSGAIEVIGAKVAVGENVKVPVGKKIPLLGIENTQLEIEAPQEALTKMESSSIPREWDDLAASIATEKVKGTLYKVLVLGEVDTGKTFFSTYLANRLLEKVGKTAILDCDTGQSDIGCPGTFGMLVLKKQEIFLTEVEPTHMYFLGAHSPGLHFVPALTGLVEMLRKAEKDADALIIDTTGWVQGDGGRAIKRAKLDIVQPDKVVLMQRGTELEHLVRHLPPEKIVRLPVSKKASSTSQMDRKELRELVSRRYFAGAKVFEIPFRQVFTDRSYFLTGTKIELDGTLYAEKLSGWEGSLVVTSGPLVSDITKDWPKDLGMIRSFIAGQEKGLMVALIDAQQNMLAVARLEEMDFLNNNFRIRSNYRGDLGQIKGIQFGSLKITESGNEAGFIEPGSF
ncbi:MAG: Clp1/GlmU family protein [Candidatus Riflebacteria bacterium]|nr:Clp1/GlmU family protein [Candidatus Riflebacteria bacterium]